MNPSNEFVRKITKNVRFTAINLIKFSINPQLNQKNFNFTAKKRTLLKLEMKQQKKKNIPSEWRVNWQFQLRMKSSNHHLPIR